MERLKNLKLPTIFKRLFICFSVINLLFIGSVFVKPEATYVYADTNIDDSNSKSIFINLAFMVMGALGIQTVRSVTGLGNDFADSLGNLYDNWMATTSLTTQAVTALLSAHVHVTKQNQLSLAAPIYNKIADFITYLKKVPQIFTPASEPFFTYDMPGNYFVVPFTSYDGRYGFVLNNLFTALGVTDCWFLKQSSDNFTQEFRFGSFIDGPNLVIIGSSLVNFGSSYTFHYANGNGYSASSSASKSSVNVSGITYYTVVGAIANYVSNGFVAGSSPTIHSLSDAIYYLWGAGAVGGTDGTIGLPDPITRNRDTPFPGIADDDYVPLSVPGDFANDWPLDDDTDIPLAIPRAIPWVYDIPIDTPIDTPIDIPFFFDPNSPGVPIPPGLIDLPDDWYNIPLIVEPECQSLTACLLSGVETVSSNLQSFYNIHPDLAAFTSLSIGIGFALLVLGVIF